VFILSKAISRTDLEERFPLDPELFGFHFIDHIIESTDIRIRRPQSSWRVRTKEIFLLKGQ
jgi:hypothetical protein